MTMDGEVSSVTLHGNANQFRQIVLSLLNNGIDAVSQNGKTDKWINVRVMPVANGEVVMALEDNGGGIRSDILLRIFEPYYTTKGPSGGTGMGLYIAKLIIEKSFHGSISVENGEFGARFLLRIPVGK